MNFRLALRSPRSKYYVNLLRGPGIKKESDNRLVDYRLKILCYSFISRNVLLDSLDLGESPKHQLYTIYLLLRNR